jgi:hypothetical protein
MGSFCAQVGRKSHEHELLTAHARPVTCAQCRSLGSGRISRTTGSEATGRAGQQACWTTREHLRIDADSKRRRSATRFRGHPPSGRISLHLRSQALATIAIRTVQIEPSLLSFLKERGRSSLAVVVVLVVVWPLSAMVWARRVRRRCPGSAGGRPRSGRRPWTLAPRGACCVGGQTVIFSRWVSVSAPSPRSLGMGTAVMAVGHSYAARGGMEVFDRGRPGEVIQVGDHAGGAGGQTQTRPAPGRGSGRPTQAGGQTTNRPALGPLFGWLMSRRG